LTEKRFGASSGFAIWYLAGLMSLTTQQSILIGFVAAGCLIGAAIYFGLASGRGSASGDSVSPLGSAGPSAERPGSGVRPVDPPTPASNATPAQVAADAKKAVDAQRPALIKKCWETAAAPQGSAGSWKAIFNITFDATGQQVARGIVVDRSSTRYEVTNCVNDNLSTLKIPAPGAVATAEVPLSLP
jgi:hypothetical protein